MAAFDLEPVNPDFVAVIHGLDLSKEPDRETVEAIERAIWKYGVLVFPGQPLTQEQQVAFAAKIGPLYVGKQMQILKNFNKRMRHEALTDISNLDDEGDVLDPASSKAISGLGNRFWHTDAAYEPNPFRYSILQAVAVPEWGGETQFADLRAAWDSLDAKTKSLIEGRTVTFFANHVRHVLGIDDPDWLTRSYPPVTWPIVRKHPGSGRDVLWVDSKVVAVSGMSVPEGRAIVHELLEHIGQRENVYSQRWSKDDIVMWDNRSVVHRVRRFDPAQRREMRRVAIVDDSDALGEGVWPSYVPDDSGE